MANMLDYLAWRGYTPFSCMPFNDVDNLILSEFAYLLPEHTPLQKGTWCIRDLNEALSDHPAAFGAMEADNRRLLEGMAAGERFSAASVCFYLHETDLTLEKQFAAVTLSDKIKTVEGAMSVNAELKAATVDYAKTRAVFDGYKAVKYSRKYLAEHEADIEIHRAAQATFRRVLAGRSSPKWTRSKPNGKSSPRRKRPPTKNTAPSKRTCGSLSRQRPISTICSA